MDYKQKYKALNRVIRNFELPVCITWDFYQGAHYVLDSLNNLLDELQGVKKN